MRPTRAFVSKAPHRLTTFSKFSGAKGWRQRFLSPPGLVEGAPVLTANFPAKLSIRLIGLKLNFCSARMSDGLEP
jgi:hypothetical protein